LRVRSRALEDVFVRETLAAGAGTTSDAARRVALTA
jgi:hypothetical protein